MIAIISENSKKRIENHCTKVIRLPKVHEQIISLLESGIEHVQKFSFSSKVAASKCCIKIKLGDNGLKFFILTRIT